ncbi:MAG: curli-like amyloid fiber formation chaperone CsgH [Sphingomonas sp.]
MIRFAALAALLVPLASSPVFAMNDRPQALQLDVRQTGDAIEVQLIGHSPRAQQVSYTLEVTGLSTSRHRGMTTLAANAHTVLSTVRVNAGETWCVRLLAEEEGREPYEIRAGDCATQ